MTPIKLHDLKPAPGRKPRRPAWVAVQGSKGKTAGRGTKGTEWRKTCRRRSRVAGCRFTCGCPSSRASATGSARIRGRQCRRPEQAVPQGRRRRCRRTGGGGRGSQELSGQGARRRQADREGQRHRAQVQWQREGQDHGRRRFRDRGAPRFLSVGLRDHFGGKAFHLLAVLGHVLADRIQQDHVGACVEGPRARRAPHRRACPTPERPGYPASFRRCGVARRRPARGRARRRRRRSGTPACRIVNCVASLPCSSSSRADRARRPRRMSPWSTEPAPRKASPSRTPRARALGAVSAEPDRRMWTLHRLGLDRQSRDIRGSGRRTSPSDRRTRPPSSARCPR